MKYFVKITHNGETAILICDSLEDAIMTKVAFENYGKYSSIEILMDRE